MVIYIGQIILNLYSLGTLLIRHVLFWYFAIILEKCKQVQIKYSMKQTMFYGVYILADTIYFWESALFKFGK